MLKNTTNLMRKVLKRTQLHEYYFLQTLLHYFMHLQFKFYVYGNNSLSDT
jgi:phosphate starvation-inducible membrane PsiE